MQFFYSPLEAMVFLLGIGCVGFFILARQCGHVSLANQFFLGSFAASVASIPAGMVFITKLYT